MTGNTLANLGCDTWKRTRDLGIALLLQQAGAFNAALWAPMSQPRTYWGFQLSEEHLFQGRCDRTAENA